MEGVKLPERLKTVWIDAGRNGIDMKRQVTPKITRVLESAEKDSQDHAAVVPVGRRR